jgi:hypothetical protein
MIRLVFVHHSTGGNWLADPTMDSPYGGLGQALMDNNYYVSATNYGWGPDGIGDRTDIVSWPEWFTGPNRDAIMQALYTEGDQNEGGFGAWSRLAVPPAGENTIVMFKSCFPNSDLHGDPDDPPLSEPNEEYTVANAKAVYNNILTYFAARQDKLFVVITAPPLVAADTAPERAANARAFSNWLVNDWLSGYPHGNVAVFDYYNVLTSNGGNTDTSDLGWAAGNHHRWWNGAVSHEQSVPNNMAAYPSDDSHPNSAGQCKATGEFVSLLNVFYNRWRGVENTATATTTATATVRPSTATPTTTASPGTATSTATARPGTATRTPAGRRVNLPLIARPGPTPSSTPSAPTSCSRSAMWRRAPLRGWTRFPAWACITWITRPPGPRSTWPGGSTCSPRIRSPRMPGSTRTSRRQTCAAWFIGHQSLYAVNG